MYFCYRLYLQNSLIKISSVKCVCLLKDVSLKFNLPWDEFTFVRAYLSFLQSFTKNVKEF